jgi:hypothetical protein
MLGFTVTRLEKQRVVAVSFLYEQTSLIITFSLFAAEKGSKGEQLSLVANDNDGQGGLQRRLRITRVYRKGKGKGYSCPNRLAVFFRCANLAAF